MTQGSRNYGSFKLAQGKTAGQQSLKVQTAKATKAEADLAAEGAKAGNLVQQGARSGEGKKIVISVLTDVCPRVRMCGLFLSG